MVGVAGRSKGCRTCRARKKGCDLQKPACGQCKDRGIACGGYDTDRVFIHTVAQHEERRSNAARHAAPPRSSGTDLATSVTLPRDTRRSTLPENLAPTPLVLPAALLRNAFSEKSLEGFLSIYIPNGDPKSVNAEGKEFMDLIPVLSVRDEAMRLATLAIGTVALGREDNNELLTQKGRTIYSQALIETRKALQDPVRARSTAILAIPRVLAIYEILFSAGPGTSSQATSWLSHAEGEVALIVARGPESYIDEDQHRLFCNARYRPLIAAVRTRTPSVLNEEVWKTVPWRGRVKTPNDKLLDILAAVPEILERVDKFGLLSSGSVYDEAKDLETTAMCWNLHFQMQEWITSYSGEVYNPVDDTPTPITEFADIDTACLTVRYWVTALLLYSSLDTACRIPPSDESTWYPDRPHPRLFARWIVRSSSYFFSPEYGITGATSLSFPLGNAFVYMARSPKLDGPYMMLVQQAFKNPKLPTTIMNFLNSMGRPVTFRGKALRGRDEL